ncbi:MAG: imelysin family protein [Myxococcota bacterium]|nr:imelysin family protein [Myxococcota bacterium]
MNKPALLLPLLSMIVLSACGKAEPVVPENTSEMMTNYAAIVSASYEDSVTAAKDLDAAIDTFAADPTQANLAAARQAWLDSREPYLQTEVYRFYGGPIDDEDGPEGLLNAWPLDEAYIDYVEGNADAGIIQDDSVEISAASLESLNEQGGEENIATGYHAIEFLLWGQDMNPDGPGDRSYTDYVDAEGNAANSDRRTLYLTTASDLLITHLESVESEWAEGGNNYRATFVASEPADGLRDVLTGMIILSGFETGGERLQTALDSGDQEDEHSCFSDNTHRDMIQDVQGIQNVYLGTYTRLDGTKVSGTGVKDVIAARDADLANEIEAQIAKSLAAAKAMNTPFDQEIASDNPEGRARVEALIVSLRAQEDLLEDAFRLFELDIPVAE